MELTTRAEENLYYWLHDQLGSFTTSLFDLIAKADLSNQRLLAKGFPDEVEVYKRYLSEDSYWAELQQRMNK